MSRVLFVLAPAGQFGVIFGIAFHPTVGCILALCMIGLGIDATRARPVRGEGKHDRVS